LDAQVLRRDQVLVQQITQGWRFRCQQDDHPADVGCQGFLMAAVVGADSVGLDLAVEDVYRRVRREVGLEIPPLR
ncbi:MAG: hypothetical protein KJ867_08300, partial [Gammaproteobacteria bacterium]|nr:hypothetical protein [Gammaproteobacteria bacterium]